VIRAVIDTNVLVSGMIAPSGNEALLLLAINQELVSPCFSDEILQEYEQVLRRPKFGFEAEEVESLLNLIRRRGELIQSAPILPLSPDPGDDKFIACALASKSEFLVTGNKRHYQASWLSGTKLVNAGELVQLIAALL
jgi:putative PIN family toxin of toxin-antitoxin system